MGLLIIGAVVPQERVQPPGTGDLQVPFMDISIRQPETNKEVALSLQLLLLLAVLTLSPSILVLTTSFLRISISL